MSLLSNSNAIAASGDAVYPIDQSLRFRNSAAAYLSRIPASNGNLRKWTWSGWVKRGLISPSGLYPTLISTTLSASFNDSVYFTTTNDYIQWNVSNSGTILITSNLFRDPSAWYHIVLMWDTDNATASNRAKIYVNGIEASYSTDNRASYLNRDSTFNRGSVTNYVGGSSNSVLDFDGQMAEVHFVDGQALTPSDFGEYGNETGAWQAKAYTGSYGTNGFYLDMSTSGSTVTDQSGNSNNYTATNMNLTTSTATTYDKMSDVPTLTDEDTGNFAVLNSIDLSNSSYYPSNANLTYYIAPGNANNQRGSIAVDSGKWYWECTIQTGGGNALIGVARADLKNDTTINFNTANGWYYYGLTGNKYNAGNKGAYGSTFTTGDVIGFALDMDSGKIWWSKNGVWQASGNPATGTNAAFTNVSGLVTSNVNNGYGGTMTGDYNFGQRPFAYTPPTGYLKINTFNLPDSGIKNGKEHFEAAIYSGNNSRRDIPLDKFNPSVIWTKTRNHGYNHFLYNKTVGNSSHTIVNSISAPNGNNGLVAFSPQSAPFGYDLVSGQINESGKTYVSWNWRGSDSTYVTNTAGSITSQVDANPTSGFSLVTYTGNASSGSTVGHGLGSVPKMIITKTTNTSLGNWAVYHQGAGATKVLYFNTTIAATTGANWWNNTAPTSTRFTIGNSNDVNGGSNYLALCFAEIPGFSKFGTYVGNGSTYGPFVYTGFRPAFIITKNSTAGGEWEIYDTTRNKYNVINTTLETNSAGSELPYYSIDILSNGFKQRQYYNTQNQSAQTFIYMAFAENPFKNSLAR